MSKKPQPQKVENAKNKIQIVDQQNEPFLRALQKKIRNINKKLTQISELQGKENLKVEQVEKINRKDNLLEERNKIEQTATFFKEVYAENAAHYRNNQLKQLEVLARAISIYHSANKTPEQAKLAALWRVLEQTDKTYPTLNIAITTLTNALKDFANDKKLQKTLATYVQEQGNNEIKTVQINQEKIVNDILQQKPSKQPTKKIEEPLKEEPVKTEVFKVQPVKVEPVEVAKSEPAKVEQKPLQVLTQPIADQTEAKPVSVQEAPKVTQAVVEQQATPINEPQPTAAGVTGEVKTQGGEKGERRDYRNRDNRDNRDRPYRGKGGNYRGGRGDGEKRQYKPKYEQKQDEERPNRQQSSSSSSSEQMRQFKKDEISRLQNQGFIVVGKPKPKAKDQHEVLQAYDRTHGKKHHHHHHAKNS